jgi:hypothetical protein
MSVDTVLNRIEAEANKGTGGTKEEINSLDAKSYLQSIYRNPMEETGVRMRAAIECLPFEKPKLTAIASSVMDSQSFGALLDRAIERSSRPMKLIEAQPLQTEHPPVELKPMPRLRRI